MRNHRQIREERSAVKRIIVMALSVVLALSLAMPTALGQVGQGSKASGTASELVAAWWQWALSEPAATNPLLGSYTGGPKCNGQPVTATQGKKWFLAGTLNGESVTRTCTIPVGTQLFFPIVHSVVFLDQPGENEEEAREIVNTLINRVLADPEFRETLVVTVDGKQVKSNRIVRAESPPGLFTTTLPENNVFQFFGVPLAAGEYPSVADGLWVALPPLSKGEHTIRVAWSAPQSFRFPQDNTYRLTVVTPNSGS
jgi:hypothetical protein